MGLQGHRRENHQLPRAFGSIDGHVPHPQIRGSPSAYSAYRLIDSRFGSVRLLDPGFRAQKPERRLDISPLPCSAKDPKATCHKAMFALPYQNPRSNPQKLFNKASVGRRRHPWRKLATSSREISPHGRFSGFAGPANHLHLDTDYAATWQNESRCSVHAHGMFVQTCMGCTASGFVRTHCVVTRCRTEEVSVERTFWKL